MTRRRAWIGCGLLALVAGVWGFVHRLDTTEPPRMSVPPEREALADSDDMLRAIQDGDVLLIKGGGLLGHLAAINDPTGQSVAHCGIAKRDGVPTPLFIHADSTTQRVIAEPLASAVGENGGWDNFIVLRGEAPDAARKAAYWAQAQAVRGVAFDFEYCDDTDDRLYCTELVLKAFHAAGNDLHMPSWCVVDRSLPAGGASHPAGLSQVRELHIISLSRDKQ